LSIQNRVSFTKYPFYLFLAEIDEYVVSVSTYLNMTSAEKRCDFD